ncbi:MAG: hypothetical protein JNK17_14195 [Hydrogenophaga sp.]|nr:hypothetical protein [Hydrogenophaga sp.]
MSAEEAYNAIAAAAIDFAADRAWDLVLAKHTTLASMVDGRWSIVKDDVVDKKGEAPKKEFRNRAFEAVRFLRDDLLRTTGQRIWGLTFTLFPDGKFKIEYDYNKPEGYEETDEVITGDEINASLSKIAKHD